MSALPTIAVHHPLDPDVMMVINKSDLTDQHVPWGHYAADDGNEVENEGGDPAEGELRVCKGPRGKWYVKLGKESLAGPFETEGEAISAKGGAAA